MVVVHFIKVGVWIGYDIIVYFPVSKSYICGILEGNYKVLHRNIEHPPLAKLLIGLFLMLPIDPIVSACMCMSIFSALTSLVVYMYAREYGEKIAILAWLLYTFDPFSIHWTIAWLDTPMLFFLSLAAYKLLKGENNLNTHILTGILIGVSALCKYSAIITALILILLMNVVGKIKLKSALYVMGAAFLMLLLNPQLWVDGGVYLIFSRNREVGNIMYPAIITYPFIIEKYKLNLALWIPSFIWAFSQCNIHIAPFLLPLICLIELVYFKAKGGMVVIPEETLVWLSSSLLPQALLPKLYPYYNVVLVPPLSAYVAEIYHLNKSKALDKENGIRRSSWRVKLLTLPQWFLIALSPLTVSLSLIFPTGWWFIWDLMRNPQVLGEISTYATIIASLALAWVIAFGYTIFVKSSTYVSTRSLQSILKSCNR